MKNVLKRAVAYIFDISIVALIATLISGTPVNPNYKKQETLNENYQKEYSYYKDAFDRVEKLYKDENINKDDVNKFYEEIPEYKELLEKSLEDEKIEEKEYNEISSKIESDYKIVYEKYFYENKKMSIYQDIISTVFIILYFVVFAFFFNGQTIGKRILKLQIVSNKDKKLNIGNYLLRCLILNGLIITLIDVFVLLTVNQDVYFTAYNYLYMASYILEFTIVFMACINEDNRGLHDLIAGTKVINLTEHKEEIIEVKDDIKEAKVKNKKEK